MAKTTTELVNAAYAAVTVSKDAPSSEDVTLITGYVAPLGTDLSNRRVIAIADMNAIPDGIFPDVVAILAERVAPSFGRPTNLEAILAAEARLLETSRLSRAGSSSLINLVMERLAALGASSDAIDYSTINNYIGPTLADLSARGVVTIANEAGISAAQFSHIVTIIAARVRPARADPNWPTQLPALAEVAEAKLREADRLSRSAGTALVQAVLRMLESLGAGADAIDATAVAGFIQSTLDDLKFRRVTSIASEGAITASQFQHVATLIAAKAKPGVVDAGLVQASENALAQIYRFDRTQDPLVLAVLEQLEIFGQSRSVIDGTMIAARIPQFLAELAAKKIAYFSSSADVTDQFVPTLARYIAASLSNPPLYAVKVMSEAELRAMSVEDVDDEPIAAEYF